MKVFCEREAEDVDCETCDKVFVKMREERQEAYERIRILEDELRSIKPHEDEDYRYRVEQIAAMVLAEWAPQEDIEDKCIEDAIRMARKLVCAVEAMDRG